MYITVPAEIAFNFCVSTLLIVLSLYLPSALAFSTLPGLILITTLFRLGISISTTRLILLQADAGNIVEAFGNFVAGIVIFLILAVVQFLVITKGAERVAEVTARFTLDAMPGKQLSIDSDLRSNLITPNDARRRRADLSKEGKLFGTMDGTMKFVKGDAIAGLVIIAVNLLGGFAIGVFQQDMAAGDAIRLYSVLTIGDGLVAQIPALLIALTSGIVITRVSPDGDTSRGNLGLEIVGQLLMQPRALAVVAGAMFMFALVPGMPTAAFPTLTGLIGLGFGVRALLNKDKEAKIAAAAAAAAVNTVQDIEANQDLRRFNPARPYVLLFSANATEREEFTYFMQAIRRARNAIVGEYGMMLLTLDIDSGG